MELFLCYRVAHEAVKSFIGESTLLAGKRLAFHKLLLIFHNGRSLSIAQSSNQFMNVTSWKLVSLILSFIVSQTVAKRQVLSHFRYKKSHAIKWKTVRTLSMSSIWSRFILAFRGNSGEIARESEFCAPPGKFHTVKALIRKMSFILCARIHLEKWKSRKNPALSPFEKFPLQREIQFRHS